MNNKVNFLRGTATEYEASTKDSDVFYYTTDTKKLYLGTNEVTGVGKAGIGENSEIFNDYESNEAYGKYSHAEGLRTHANNFSHAEGLDTQASGDSAHAEGSTTIASGNSAHAEGTNTTASGWYSHAEGYMTIASNMHTHAGGTGSEASKEGSFAHGRVAKASNNDYEVAFGTFNKSNADTLFSIGNGADEDTRSNAFEITETTGKLFDKEIAVKSDIPTTLPANGGNADTVDNLHAANFFQNIGRINTGSLIDYILTMKSSGWIFVSENVTDTPVAGQYFVVQVHEYAGGYGVTATQFNTGATYYNGYNGTSKKWYGWQNVADNGNAATLEGLHANEIVSNPNLLINPDFAVNQRAQASYSASGYTVDRWKIGGANLTVNDGFVTLENTTGKGTATLYQIVENPSALSGKTVTLSFDCDLKTEGAWISVQAVTNGSWNPSTPVQFTNTGRSVKSIVINLPDNLTDLQVVLVIHGTDDAPLAAVDIYGAKLELGKIATPIIPADPAAELLKCQRYLWVLRNSNMRIGATSADNENYAVFYMHAPAAFRRVPTVSYENLALLLRSNGNVTKNIDSIRIGCTSNIIKMYVNVASDSLLTVGEWYELGHQPGAVGALIFDAEI